MPNQGAFMQQAAQLDMFYTDKENYLYCELQKIQSSLDRRTRSMFAMITELQDEIIRLKHKENHDS